MTDSWNDPKRDDPEPSSVAGADESADPNPPSYQAPATQPRHETPQYETPQYETPQYQAPQGQTPQYQAPQYVAPQYQPPQYQAAVDPTLAGSNPSPQVDPYQPAAGGYAANASYQPGDPNAAYSQPQYGSTSPVYPGGTYGAGTPVSFDPNAPVLASFGQRVQGWFLNWFLLGTVLNIISSMMFNPTTDPNGWRSSSFISFAIVAVVLGLLTKNGQGPGNRWARTQIVDADGRPVSGTKAIVRNLAHYVDSLICGIGWLFPIWDEQRQTLGDKIMKTHVIDVSQTGPRS